MSASGLKEIRVDLEATSVRTVPYEGDRFAKDLAVDRLIQDPEPENLVYLTGYTPLVAAGFGFAGKLNLYGVSRLGGNLQGSRSGGLLGTALARRGIVGVALRGRTAHPCVLVLESGSEGRLVPLSHLGTGIADTFRLARALFARYGRNLALGLVSPGSTGFRYPALVCNDRVGALPSRAAARSTTIMGVNGCMGIAVPMQQERGRREQAPGLSPPARARRLCRRLVQIRANDALRGRDEPEDPQDGPGPLLGGTWGAAAEVRLDLGHGLTNLFRDAHVPDEHFPALLPGHQVREQLRQAAAARLVRKRHACLPGCPNRCSQQWVVPGRDGHATLMKAGEWETVQGLLNLGIFEDVLPTAAWVLEHSNRHAYDHIEALVAVGALALATEGGTPTGVEYGDRDSVIRALREAASGRTERGRLLRRGAAGVQDHYGLPRHFTVGGHALPFHNGRAMLQTGAGLSWTYGRHGECCAGAGRLNFLGDPYDPSDHTLAPEVHVLNTVHAMVLYGAVDALGACFFMGPSLATLVDVWRLYAAMGLPYDIRDRLQSAAGTLRAVHAFNRRRGVTMEPLPPVFYERATRGNAQEPSEAVRFDVPFPVIRDHGAEVLDAVAEGRQTVPDRVLDPLVERTEEALDGT